MALSLRDLLVFRSQVETMSALPELFTYADLDDMPADSYRYEIIAGELVVAPAPRFEHQFVLLNLLEFLKTWLEKDGEWRAFPAPIDLVVGPYDVVQPDIMVLATSQIARFREIGIVDLPPRVVVEVLSPGTASVDLRAKLALYARFGILEYWTIDPRTREMNMFVLESDIYSRLPLAIDGSVASRVLPGCTLNPGVVFGEDDS